MQTATSAAEAAKSDARQPILSSETLIKGKACARGRGETEEPK